MNKNFVFVVLTALMLFGTLASAYYSNYSSSTATNNTISQTDCSVIGNINGLTNKYGKAVDASDVQLVTLEKLGRPSASAVCETDISGDNIVDSCDVELVKKASIGYDLNNKSTLANLMENIRVCNNTPVKDCRKRGDIDGDGKINATDVQMAYNEAWGRHSSNAVCSADVSENGKNTLCDYVLVKYGANGYNLDNDSTLYRLIKKSPICAVTER
ncbi:MAG: dockerin type I domain-containing protein [archaeon]|nr:dockerin type I domain-containing protein [archaeon]